MRGRRGDKRVERKVKRQKAKDTSKKSEDRRRKSEVKTGSWGDEVKDKDCFVPLSHTEAFVTTVGLPKVVAKVCSGARNDRRQKYDLFNKIIKMPQRLPLHASAGRGKGGGYM